MEVLYGTCSNNCAGYCKKHCTGLTVKQIRKKECLQKECWHLQKIDHEWWAQRERMKEKRKNRKERICGGINNV